VSETPTSWDDGTGYCVSDSDLAFLGLTREDLHKAQSRIAPLGMSPSDYDWMVDDLLHALARDGISDADIRLQGSSAHLYSGWHKYMPYTRAEVHDALTSIHGQAVSGQRVTDALALIEGQWPTDPRPFRRPFDSMHRVQIDPDPSDYDLQICSDQMIERLRVELDREDVNLHEITSTNARYQFVLKFLCVEYFKYVDAWASRAAARVNRPVTWAVFDGKGPQESQDEPHKSSHFKDSDWIVRLGQSGALEPRH
jgi:hypothetical protein